MGDMLRPAMQASLDVVARSSDITATAPAVLAAATQADAAVISKRIAGEHQQLIDAVTRLSGHNRAVATLTSYAAQMRQQLDALAAIVDQRLRLRAALERVANGITAAQRDTSESLAPLLDDAAYNLTMDLLPGNVPGTPDLAGGILEMSHQLNVNVTAEGVETSAQLALLRSGHCDEIQGFLLGRPMRSEKVKDYLAGVCSVVEAEEPDAHRPDCSDSCALQQPLAQV
jgi:EAL domain